MSIYTDKKVLITGASTGIGYALAEELNILDEKNLSTAMGTLSFKPVSASETTLVAFTFVFCLEDGEIKIKIHHSSPVL